MRAYLASVTEPLFATWHKFHADRHLTLEWLADPCLRQEARTAATGPCVEERIVVNATTSPSTCMSGGRRGRNVRPGRMGSVHKALDGMDKQPC
jgi:hypothetical protein